MMSVSRGDLFKNEMKVKMHKWSITMSENELTNKR